MKKLTKSLKTMLNALAHADAGEHLIPRQKAAFLSRGGAASDQIHPEVPAADQAETSNRRRIALYMGSELPSEVMDYMIQTCIRMKHDLVVLTFQSNSTAQTLLNPYNDALASAGIDMKLVTLTGNSITHLARYLRGRPEIAFLACRETGYLGHCYLNGTQQNALPVPVVVVVTRKEGMQNQEVDSKKVDENARTA